MQVFKGTLRLAKLALRLDRFKLTIAIVSVGLLAMLFTTVPTSLFETEAQAAQGAKLLANNPAMRLFGLPTGADYGNILMLRTYTMFVIVVGLISTFAIVRHTRQNEEQGRSELVQANVVGRYSFQASSIIIVAGANIVMSALILMFLLLRDYPLAGSFGMAGGIGLAGMSFGVIALVVAQFSQTSRGANGLASMAVIGGFLVSGIASALGHVQSNGVAVDPAWIVWTTPFGWGQMLMPFAGENWWPLLIFAALIVVGVLVGFLLARKRDVGQGLLPARSGRAEAKLGLLSIMGLTWRLNRTVFLSWLFAMSLLGTVYGLISGDIENLANQVEGFGEVIAEIGGDDMIMAFYGLVVSEASLIILVYGVQIALRMRAEEKRSLESLLSTSTSRVKWALSYIFFAVATVGILLTATTVTTALIAQTKVNQDLLWPLIAGGLAQVPVITLMVGVAVVLFGLIPGRSVPLVWGFVAFSIVIGPILGELIDIPSWVANLSPLMHTPLAPPLENIESGPLIIMSAVAAVLITTGLIAFRHRDIATSA